MDTDHGNHARFLILLLLNLSVKRSTASDHCPSWYLWLKDKTSVLNRKGRLENCHELDVHTGWSDELYNWLLVDESSAVFFANLCKTGKVPEDSIKSCIYHSLWFHLCFCCCFMWNTNNWTGYELQDMRWIKNVGKPYSYISYLWFYYQNIYRFWRGLLPI